MKPESEKGEDDPLHIVGSWQESSCSVPLKPSLNTHRSCRQVGFGPFGLRDLRGKHEELLKRRTRGSSGGFTRLGFVKKKTTAEKNVDFL